MKFLLPFVCLIAFVAAASPAKKIERIVSLSPVEVEAPSKNLNRKVRQFGGFGGGLGGGFGGINSDFASGSGFGGSYGGPFGGGSFGGGRFQDSDFSAGQGGFGGFNGGFF